MTLTDVRKPSQGIKMKSILSFIAAMLFVTITAQGGMVIVDGVDNIYGAGHSVAPSPSGEGGGTLPPSVSITPGAGQFVTFTNITGSITYFGDLNAPSYADGNPFNVVRDVSSYGGISGIITPTRMPIIGVFLTASEPLNPAPSRLDFTLSGLGTSFTTLSPEIGQTFFIGDGLTGTGTGSIQKFMIPVAATRVFLGFADTRGEPGDGAGSFFNNAGSFNVDVQINSVPEPASLACWIVCLGVVTLTLKRHSASITH